MITDQKPLGSITKVFKTVTYHIICYLHTQYIALRDVSVSYKENKIVYFYAPRPVWFLVFNPKFYDRWQSSNKLIDFHSVTVIMQRHSQSV